MTQLRLVLAAVLAQSLDLATYRAAAEANPLVLALGPAAPLLKLLLLVVLASGWYAFRARWRAVLIVGLCVGLVGAATNVL